MLRRDSGMSVSIFDGFRQNRFFHVGRGLLPLLAVMLLATPQLAFGQTNLPVTVEPTELDIAEGTSGTYTVKLDAPLATNVRVTMEVVGAGDAVAVTETLDFASDNWSDAQTVSVLAAEDDDAVDEVVTLTHTATIATTTDGTTTTEEVTLRNASVTVTVDDNETQAVTVTALSSSEVPEAGSATYTVALVTEPTAPVTVDIGGTSGEITVSPSRLVFHPTDTHYRTAQTVTVYAGEDLDAEDDTATLTHTVRGGDYTGVAADPVSVTVGDNDTRGVTVAPPTLNIAAGARGTFSVVLDTQPTSTVRITVTEDSDDLSVSPSSVGFSPSNWNRPQTVTVRVSSSTTASATLTTAVAASGSRDESYDNADVTDVEVTISTTRPVVRLSRSSLTVDEGSDAKYTVRLASESWPDTSQTVTVNIPTGSGFSTTDTSLIFTGTTDGDWNTPQTVTVTAASDDNAVQETTTITHTIDSAIVTNGILQATVRESDRRGITITPTSLEVTEGGTARYNVVLNSEPVGDTEDNVTVTVGGVSGDVTVAPSQLVFTDGDWQSAQEVVVSAAERRRRGNRCCRDPHPHGARRGLRPPEGGQRPRHDQGNRYARHSCGYDGGYPRG